MNIPFSLRFLKKVELFQVLKKLDSQSKSQMISLRKALPLWEAEKKILFWAFEYNKHLGSPLLADDLRSKKSFVLKRRWGNNNERKVVRDMNANKFEVNFEKVLKFNEWELKEIKNIGKKKNDIGFTTEEIDKLGVRKIFGNLVSRGYAKYDADIQKELSHYEGRGNIQYGVYTDTPTTQANCKGVLITKEGILMGELINDLYRLRKSGEKMKWNFPEVSMKYIEKTKTNCILVQKGRGWLVYPFLIYISYVALGLIILYILKASFQEIHLVYSKLKEFGFLVKLKDFWAWFTMPFFEVFPVKN